MKAKADTTAATGTVGLGFGDVIPILKAKDKATRAAWKDDDMHIESRDGEIVAVFEHDDGAANEIWVPTADDLFANDWEKL
jgi:hypothetical protein